MRAAGGAGASREGAEYSHFRRTIIDSSFPESAYCLIRRTVAEFPSAQKPCRCRRGRPWSRGRVRHQISTDATRKGRRLRLKAKNGTKGLANDQRRLNLAPRDITKKPTDTRTQPEISEVLQKSVLRGISRVSSCSSLFLLSSAQVFRFFGGCSHTRARPYARITT